MSKRPVKSVNKKVATAKKISKSLTKYHLHNTGKNAKRSKA